jgi:hypothetical protein
VLSPRNTFIYGEWPPGAGPAPRPAVSPATPRACRGRIGGSESIEELAEEGQGYAADMGDAIENAPDDQGEVRDRKVREGDVPQEYLDGDREGRLSRAEAFPSRNKSSLEDLAALFWI